MFKREVFILEDLKPSSVNAATVNSNRGGRCESPKAKEYRLNVFNRLDNEATAKSFKNLREAFIPKLHAFEVAITTFYPYKDFVAKETGCISSKTIDCSNFEKGLIDLFFLPKHADEVAPYGCQNLQLDDKYITELHSYKKVSKDQKFRIQIEIKIIPRDF